jgi:hypothetical protein
MSNAVVAGEAEIATARADYRAINGQRRIDGSDADIGRCDSRGHGDWGNSGCQIFKNDVCGTEYRQIVLTMSFEAASLPNCGLGECQTKRL